MKLLQLVNTKICAKVDDEDFELCARHTWYIFKYKRTSYAKAIVEGVWIGLHTFILPPPLNLTVDHKDSDGLNNQKYNLRHATLEQQRQNKSKHLNSTSKYKGVSLNDRGSWTAQICIKGKQTSLGRFNTELSAARAYNRAAIEHYGEFAKLNICTPNVEGGAEIHGSIN